MKKRWRKNMRRFNIIVILTVLFACATISDVDAKRKKNKKPDWLINPENKFPSAYFLTAIGEADSRTDAENMAAANISRIFESNVSASQTVSTRYNEIINNSGVSSSENTDIRKNVNVSSEQKLMNVKFADSYTDKMGRVFVIGYIDRMKTATIYEDKIAESSLKVIDFMKNGENSKNYIISYANYNAAKLFDDQINIMLAQLGIISSNSKEMIELGYDAISLAKKRSEAAKLVTFKIDIKNDFEDKMKIVLEELFTSMGFNLSENNVITVTGDVDFEETDLKRDDYVFVRYDLKLKVIDDRGDVVAALTQKGREGHTSFTEAKARAILKLEKKIDKKLKKKVIQYFDNLVK